MTIEEFAAKYGLVLHSEKIPHLNGFVDVPGILGDNGSVSGKSDSSSKLDAHIVTLSLVENWVLKILLIWAGVRIRKCPYPPGIRASMGPAWSSIYCEFNPDSERESRAIITLAKLKSI
jgi:hypothetical protein